MLQSIRDHTQGWIAGVIISILILSFALWGIHSYISGEGGGTNIVANVNGVEITKNQFAASYERLRRQMQMQLRTPQLPTDVEANIKHDALQSLIDLQVLKQASLSEKYRVSSNQIDNFLTSLPEFQVNGQFSPARFQQIIERALYNPNDFIDLIATSLLIDQPRLGIIFSSFALPNEVTTSLALVNQERDVDYALIQPVKTTTEISNDDIKAYYDQHQDEFKTPELVSVEYLELSSKDLMKEINPTDDALKAYYNENTSSFSTPAQWKLDSLLVPVAANATADEIKSAEQKANSVYEKAKSGADVTALQKEFSLEKTPQKLNGWVSAMQIPEELQKPIQELKAKGDVTTPIQTSEGFIIFKLMDRKDPVVQSFAEAKTKVKEAVQKQQADEKFADVRNQLSNLTYEHPESLQNASETLDLPVKTTGLFSKEKGGNDISSETKVREAAFTNDVLNQQNNSDVIPISEDTAIVLRIKNHTPASLKPLESVRADIINTLKSAAIEEKTAKLATEINQKLQSGENPTDLAKQYQLSWKSLGFIGRQSNKANPAIVVAAFEAPRPDPKPTYAMTKTENGYAVIALKGVRTGSVTNENQYHVYGEQIQNTQGLMEYELYKQSLIKQAKISTEN